MLKKYKSFHLAGGMICPICGALLINGRCYKCGYVSS